MRKSVWITALSLMAAGVLIVAIAFAALNFDLTKLDTNTYIDETFTISPIIFSIDADIDTADIQFHLSDDEKLRVECTQMTESAPITAEVRDSVLYISQNDNRAWYEHIGFFFRSPKITVYLPHPNANYDLKLRGSTCDVNISQELTFRTINARITTGDIQCDAQVNTSLSLQTSTGNITCQDAYCNSINLKASTGRIWAVDLDCYELDIRTSTGDIRAKGCKTDILSVKASTGDVRIVDCSHSHLTVTTSTGDVNLDDCESDYLCITTSTGDVSGTIAGPMDIDCETNTGDIDVVDHGHGGLCRVTTDTGDIHITTN